WNGCAPGRGRYEKSPERGLCLTNESVAFHRDHAPDRASSTKLFTVLASGSTSPFCTNFGSRVKFLFRNWAGLPALFALDVEVFRMRGNLRAANSLGRVLILVENVFV